MSKNSVVVYASCGTGHKTAAYAIAKAFGLPCVDILDYSFPLVKKFYSSGYSLAVKYFSFIWKLIFLITQYPPVITFINKINFILFAGFYKFIENEKPGIVITTHFFPIYIIKMLKRRLNIKLLIVITDIGVHPLWVDKSADYYFTAMDWTKDELIKKGISKDKITVTGIPLRAGFKETIDSNLIRKQISLDSKKVILMFSNAMSVRFVKKVLEGLGKRFNFIIIYGRDKKLKLVLEKYKDSPIRYFPYYANIWEFVNIASFIVTKPGGLTVFECLYKHRPMIFTHFIWGQEKVNMDIAIKLGAGVYAPSLEALIEAVNNFDSSKISRLSFDDKKAFSVLKDIMK